MAAKLYVLGSFWSKAYPTKLLDLDAGSATDGTPVILWEKNGGLNQEWRLVSSWCFFVMYLRFSWGLKSKSHNERPNRRIDHYIVLWWGWHRKLSWTSNSSSFQRPYPPLLPISVRPRPRRRSARIYEHYHGDIEKVATRIWRLFVAVLRQGSCGS